ncbi:membrane protein [Sporosarcina sp. NCCP-2716]|uniref:DUF2500 domain-containing protein n=1 Tax=Sporosarcina sp. NCCP-2716 TaxID=2943679 RepID=UPI00203FCEFB|nr:DUF2500 domain-containing protein [Sporosarcina sp. NCCP-2716]GKV68682.1 membrane protein [Sporosarcina sp. NCCP-2716]
MDPFSPFFFGGFSIVFTIIFLLVAGTFLFVIVKGITEWNKNNHSPQLTVAAHVKTKRTETTGGSGDSSASTWYYVTFEYESGDRQEFGVNGRQFGMLAEGDYGILRFQGTRYLDFERSAA